MASPGKQRRDCLRKENHDGNNCCRAPQQDRGYEDLAGGYTAWPDAPDKTQSQQAAAMLLKIRPQLRQKGRATGHACSGQEG